MKHNVRPPPGHCQWSLTAMACACVCYRQPWVPGGRSDGTEDDPLLHRRFEVGAAGGAQFEPAGPLVGSNPPSIPPPPNQSHQPTQPTSSPASCLKFKAPSDPTILCFILWFSVGFFSLGTHYSSICIIYHQLPSTKSAASEFRATSDFNVMCLFCEFFLCWFFCVLLLDFWDGPPSTPL